MVHFDAYRLIAYTFDTKVEVAKEARRAAQGGIIGDRRIDGRVCLYRLRDV